MQRTASAFAHKSVAFAALLSFGQLGCDTARAKNKRELERLSHLIDQNVHAQASAKTEQLELLRTVACEHLCVIKQTCVEGFELQVAALLEIKGVRKRLDEDASQTAGTVALAELLSAEARLSESKTQIEKCLQQREDWARRLR